MNISDDHILNTRIKAHEVRQLRYLSDSVIILAMLILLKNPIGDLNLFFVSHT